MFFSVFFPFCLKDEKSLDIMGQYKPEIFC